MSNPLFLPPYLRNHYEIAPRGPFVVALGSVLATAFPILGTSTILGISAGTIAAFLLTTAVTSWAASALAPDGGKQQKGLLTNVRDPAAAGEIVYGEIRKGGVITFMEASGSNNKYLHIILTLACHEVNSIGDLYINDEVVSWNSTTGMVTTSKWGNKIRIRKFTGAAGQTTPSELLSETSVTNTFVGNGIAYLYIRLEYSSSVFADGIPVFSAKVQGKKTYNVSDATTSYSNLSSRAIRDYLLSHYGVNSQAFPNSIDDAAMLTANNICNQNVNLAGGGTEKRYTTNIVLSTADTPKTNLEKLLTACGGNLYWGQGLWHLTVGAFSSSVLTLTENDLVGDLQVTTKNSRKDNFNAVIGTFNNAASDYLTMDYPEVSSSTFISHDNGEKKVLNMDFPGTTTASAAQRLAKMALFRSREQFTVQAVATLKAVKVQPGDTVSLTLPRYGWSDKTFEVVTWNLVAGSNDDGLCVELTLRETSAAAYDWAAEESSIINNNTNLVDPRANLNVTNLSVTRYGNLNPDGNFIGQAQLNWDISTNPYASVYNVQWKKASESVWHSTSTVENSCEVGPIEANVSYNYRVQVVTLGGFVGAWTQVNYTLTGDNTIPGSPTGITATGGYKYIQINWTNVADSDLSHVNVYMNTANSGVGRVLLGKSTGTFFVHDNLPNNATRYYWLKSVDFSGNETAAFTSVVSATTVVIPTSDLSGTISDAQIADGAISIAKFAAGLRPIEVVGSLPSTGNVVGRVVLLTTDQKLYRWNGTAWTSAVPAVDISGQILEAQIADNAVTVNKILNGAVTDAKIATGAVLESKLADNAVTVNKILNGAVTDAKIATGAILESKIADNAVTVNKILNGAINDAKIATGAVLESKLADNAVTVNKIANGAVGTSKIENLAITNSKLADLAVEAGKIANNAVTETKILDGSITTPKIVAGAVVTDKLAANAVTASKLFISDLQNLVISGNFNTGTDGWGRLRGTITTTVALGLAGNAVQIPRVTTEASISTFGEYETPAIAVQGVPTIAGDQFYIEYYHRLVGSPNPNSVAQIIVVDATGAVLSTHTVGAVATSASYVKVSGNVTMTQTGYAFLKLSNITDNSTVRIASVKWYRRNAGELVVDGAITTNQLAANAVTAAKIAAGTITATEIASGAITTGKIAAGAVTTTELAANAVTAAKIAAGTITATEIASGAITTGKIAASAVTATEIASGAITTGKISAGAVTTTELAAGAVTAAKIAAGTITATEIASGAITTGKIAALAVTATEIASGAITTGKIAASAVTATEIASNAVTSAKILAGAITTGKIAAGAVTATEIAANAVAASKLAVRDLQNLVVNSNFVPDSSGWGRILGSAGLTSATAPISGNAVNMIRTTTENSITTVGNFADPLVAVQGVPVIVGDQFYVEFYARRVGATNISTQAQIIVVDATGAVLSVQNVINTTVTNTTYTQASGNVTMTQTGYAFLRLLNSTDNSNVRIGSVKWYRRNAGLLIVDGALEVSGLAVFGNYLQSSNYSAGSAGWRITNAGAAEFNSLTVRQDMIVSGAVSSTALLVNSSTVNVTSDTTRTDLISATTVGPSKFIDFITTPGYAINPLKLDLSIYGSSSGAGLTDAVVEVEYNTVGAPTSWNTLADFRFSLSPSINRNYSHFDVVGIILPSVVASTIYQVRVRGVKNLSSDYNWSSGRTRLVISQINR